MNNNDHAKLLLAFITLCPVKRNFGFACLLSDPKTDLVKIEWVQDPREHFEEWSEAQLELLDVHPSPQMAAAVMRVIFAPLRVDGDWMRDNNTMLRRAFQQCRDGYIQGEEFSQILEHMEKLSSDLGTYVYTLKSHRVQQERSAPSWERRSPRWA